jgi:hypothetical protein
VKSASDKKEYKLIKLPNGLTSLLVQHFIEDDEADGKATTEAEESEEESGEEEADGEESEAEDDNQKEKLAAVALCIDVGSFFDPVEVQGLSHFLEHMVRTRRDSWKQREREDPRLPWWNLPVHCQIVLKKCSNVEFLSGFHGIREVPQGKRVRRVHLDQRWFRQRAD